jgi:hypothetical protein
MNITDLMAANLTATHQTTTEHQFYATHDGAAFDRLAHLVQNSARLFQTISTTIHRHILTSIQTLRTGHLG